MPHTLRALVILLGGRPIGHLVAARGRIVFFAAADYIGDPNRPVLSQSLQGETDRQTRSLLENTSRGLLNTRLLLPPFFSNLLPEGALRTRISREMKITEDAEFEILSALGQDLPGAITATRTTELPAHIPAFFGQNAEIIAAEPVQAIVENFSLAGVQLKFSVIRDARSRYTLTVAGASGVTIVKLPHPTFPLLPENEFSSMHLARIVGVETPHFWLDDMSKLDIPGLDELKGTFFAIERFDRTESSRLHIEDFAQVFATRARDKYKGISYDQLLTVIARRTREGDRDVRQAVRRLIVNILLGNGDAHLKNFSLIYRDPKMPDLAPAYDIVSTIQYMPGDSTMALSLAGEKEVANLRLAHFEKVARRIEFPRPQRLANEARDTIQMAKKLWPAELANLLISDRYRTSILERLARLPIARE